MGSLEMILKRPFREEEIEWRIQQSGSNNNGVWAMVLAYVEARAIQDRLDEAFGVNGWKTHYDFISDGVVCTLSVKNSEEWVDKQDGAPKTDVEPFKGGISGAFKRVAAAGYGIGRYLYKLDTKFAETSITKVNGWRRAKTKDGTFFYWTPPILPKWALPK